MGKATEQELDSAWGQEEEQRAEEKAAAGLAPEKAAY
jgi:hypothetical protein